jgi:hypothetical protein
LVLDGGDSSLLSPVNGLRKILGGESGDIGILGFSIALETQHSLGLVLGPIRELIVADGVGHILS